MPYSNGTPSPGEVVESEDRLYLVTGLDDRGHPIGTSSSRIFYSLFEPLRVFQQFPNTKTLTEWSTT